MKIGTIVWPRPKAGPTTVIDRLGRLTHWVSIAVAIAFLFGGTLEVIDTYHDARVSIEQARIWDENKREKEELIAELRAADAAGQTEKARETAELWSEADEAMYAVGTSRPVVNQPALLLPLALVLVLSCAIAMIGRGVRYVLSAE